MAIVATIPALEQEVEIRDSNGSLLCAFRMNLADTNFTRRSDAFAEALKSLSEIDFEDTTAYEDEIYRQIDILCGAPVSKDMFAKVGGLTPLENGDFFFEAVLEVVADKVAETVKERLATKNARIEQAAADALAENGAEQA